MGCKTCGRARKELIRGNFNHGVKLAKTGLKINHTRIKNLNKVVDEIKNDEDLSDIEKQEALERIAERRKKTNLL